MLDSSTVFGHESKGMLDHNCLQRRVHTKPCSQTAHMPSIAHHTLTPHTSLLTHTSLRIFNHTPASTPAASSVRRATLPHTSQQQQWARLSAAVGPYLRDATVLLLRREDGQFNRLGTSNQKFRRTFGLPRGSLHFADFLWNLACIYGGLLWLSLTPRRPLHCLARLRVDMRAHPFSILGLPQLCEDQLQGYSIS